MDDARWSRRAAIGAVGASLAAGAAASTTATASAGRRPRVAHTLRVVSYNVGGKGDDRLRAQIASLVEDHRPHVIAVQEVADREGLLRGIARANDYRLVQQKGQQALAHNAFLLRRGVYVDDFSTKLHGERAVNPATPGTGSGDQVAPKYINAVKVRVGDGIQWVVGNVHLVPSAERAGASWRKNREVHDLETRLCAEWFASRPAEPIILGDWNAQPSRGGFDLMRRMHRVARTFATGPTHDSRRIDHVWARKAASGSARALGGFGGDHRPVVASVTVTR